MSPKNVITLANGIRAINQDGILLVFPLANRKEPPSLWSRFFPRSKMRWEWDDGGDNRVANLWHLRTELSRSSKVVYAKWFQGRATFFSREIFTALLALLRVKNDDRRSILSPTAAEILEILEMDSPLSTKQLKAAADLQGRFHEGAYTRALKELWQRLLIVGFGEVDDGAFPSLAMGASKSIFEELYIEAQELDREEASKRLLTVVSADSPFIKYLMKHAPETISSLEG